MKNIQNEERKPNVPALNVYVQQNMIESSSRNCFRRCSSSIVSHFVHPQFYFTSESKESNKSIHCLCIV